MATLFWILVSTLAYSYVGYGLLLIVLARLRPAAGLPAPERPFTATVLIAAHNEESHIAAKLDNVLAQEVAPHALEVIVVSDGSTDGTCRAVEAYRERGVRLLALDAHDGKIAALNLGLSQAGGDLVLFTDANSLFRPGAVKALLAGFGDPAVGCVCGNLAVPEAGRGWIARAEALYWRYDHALKLAESRLGGAVSAQGSLYAVRRDLLAPIPPDVADDLNNSLRVVREGYRILFEPAAVTEEPVTGDTRGEFGRRVRSTERGWRGLMHFAVLLNPFRFGFYAFKLASHKLLRRLTPFLWLFLALATVPLAGEASVYALAGAAQLLLYGMALCAWRLPAARRLPGAGLALFFVGGHLAMARGVLNALGGRRSARWTPLRDSTPAAPGDS